MKILQPFISIFFVSLTFISCQKTVCQNCKIYEKNFSSGETAVTDLGKRCDDELDEIKSKNYTGSDGEVTIKCE